MSVGAHIKLGTGGDSVVASKSASKDGRARSDGGSDAADGGFAEVLRAKSAHPGERGARGLETLDEAGSPGLGRFQNGRDAAAARGLGSRLAAPDSTANTEPATEAGLSASEMHDVREITPTKGLALAEPIVDQMSAEPIDATAPQQRADGPFNALFVPSDDGAPALLETEQGPVEPKVPRGIDESVAAHLHVGQAPEPAQRAASVSHESALASARSVAVETGVPLAAGLGNGGRAAALAFGERRETGATAQGGSSASARGWPATAAHQSAGRPALGDADAMPAWVRLESHLRPAAQADAERLSVRDDAGAARASRVDGSDDSGDSRPRLQSVSETFISRETGQPAADVSAMTPVRQIATAITQDLGRPVFMQQAAPDNPFTQSPAMGHGPIKILKVGLEPVELGQVTVQLRTDGRSVQLAVTAERPETAERLNSDRRTLTRILESSGFDVEHVTIQIANPERTAVAAQPDSAMQSLPSQSNPQSLSQNAHGPNTGSDRQHHRPGGQNDLPQQEQQRDEDQDSSRRGGAIYV